VQEEVGSSSLLLAPPRSLFRKHFTEGERQDFFSLESSTERESREREREDKGAGGGGILLALPRSSSLSL